MKNAAHTINGHSYTVYVRERGVDFYDILYVSNKTGWSCRARTRGFADYETHSLSAAIVKAKKVAKELNR